MSSVVASLLLPSLLGFSSRVLLIDENNFFSKMPLCSFLGFLSSISEVICSSVVSVTTSIAVSSSLSLSGFSSSVFVTDERAFLKEKPLKRDFSFDFLLLSLTGVCSVAVSSAVSLLISSSTTSATSFFIKSLFSFDLFLISISICLLSYLSVTIN